MKHRVIRTYKATNNELDTALKEGWVVVFASKLGNFEERNTGGSCGGYSSCVEYILEREEAV